MAPQTDVTIYARRPDLLVIDKKRRIVEIFEVACSLDSLIEEREAEKKNKYRLLASDLRYTQCCKTNIYPIVLGDTGMYANLRQHLIQSYSVLDSDIPKLVLDMQNQVIQKTVKKHLKKPGKTEKTHRRRGKGRRLRNTWVGRLKKGTGGFLQSK